VALELQQDNKNYHSPQQLTKRKETVKEAHPASSIFFLLAFNQHTNNRQPADTNTPKKKKRDNRESGVTSSSCHR
jgi:hypothetical protein